MAKKLKKNDVVYIEWNDAYSDYNEWTDKNTDIDLILVKSIGFIHSINKDKIVIKSHFTKDNISQLTAIPIHWIKKLLKLKII